MSSLQRGYVAGLLAGLSSLRQMIVAGLIGLSLSQSSRLMKRKEQETQWQAVLSEIPPGGYLAVDYVKVKHEGLCIEGVDREQSPQGLIWGHRFLTSSIVFTDGTDAYPLRADASLSRRMATDAYPYLNPSEAMLNVVGDVLISDYDLKGLVVDSEFTSKLVLRSLPHFPVKIPNVLNLGKQWTLAYCFDFALLSSHKAISAIRGATPWIKGPVVISGMVKRKTIAAPTITRQI